MSSDSDKAATPKRARSRSRSRSSERVRSSPRLDAATTSPSQAAALAAASAAASSSAATAPSASSSSSSVGAAPSRAATRSAAAAAAPAGEHDDEDENDSDWGASNGGDDDNEENAADEGATGAAQLFSAILQRLQSRLGGGGGGGDASGDIGGDALQSILASLQQQGLVLQDDDGNIVLMGDDGEEESEEGRGAREGAASARAARATARARVREANAGGEEDEDEDEDDDEDEGEDGEEDDDDSWQEELPELEARSRGRSGSSSVAAAGGAAQQPPPLVQQDPIALREFLEYAQLEPGRYPRNHHSSLTSWSRDYIPHGPPAAHRAFVASHYIPSHESSVQEFQGRAFCGKFSNTDSGAPSRFATATQDGVVHLYDTQTWRLYKEILAEDVGWSIVDIDFSADSRFVIYSSWSSAVHLINTQGSYELHEALEFDPPAQAHCCMFGIRFSPQESREILAGLNNGVVILYDVERKRRLWSARGHDDDVNSVCWLDNSGNLFATGSDDASIRIWDRRLLGQQGGGAGEDGESSGHSSSFSKRATPVAGFLGHVHGLTCVTAMPDGAARYMLSNSKDQSMKLWDLRRTNTASATQRATEERFSQRRQMDYRWQRPSRREVQQAADELARGGDPAIADKSVMTFSGHTVAQTLIRCDFSPLNSTGCRYAVSGSACGRIFIYSLVTGEVVARLAGHRSIVRDVAWGGGNEGDVLVSSSWDHTVRRHALHPEHKLADNSAALENGLGGVGGAGARMRRRMMRRQMDDDDE